MYWPTLASDQATHGGSDVMKRSVHEPVMVSEVLRCLDCRPGRNFLDLTLGGGGHSEAILRETGPNGRLLGADRDAKALIRAKDRLKAFSSRFEAVHSSLGHVEQLLSTTQVSPLHGALIDCGVSSDQLEDPERGFSFMKSGPLDMRMDDSTGETAKEWLAQATEREIADAIFRYGEERNSRRIARAIVETRKWGSLETTEDLEEVVFSCFPKHKRTGRIHPATRTFQAIRIVVNDELNELKHALTHLLNLLPSSARLVVLTFHSLEDRIVKEVFRDAARQERVRLLHKKPMVPSEEEVHRNPRSRSTKLRAIEIVGGNG